MVRMNRHHDAGAAAILAMMFLVIFSSLAAAMAIVSQGNLATADSHLKINRAMAAAETGMDFIMFRVDTVAAGVTTKAGLIYDPARSSYSSGSVHPDGDVTQLWAQLRQGLIDSLSTDFQYQTKSFQTVNGKLTIPEIEVSPGGPTFMATLEPHPLAHPNGNLQYNADFYKREPYKSMGVSSANPLDATWVRVSVTAYDGPTGNRIERTLSMDFKIDKRNRFAILSKSRVMIGKNVIIEGPIGSRFTETNLNNGHPVQIESDFRGLHPDLDAKLDLLLGSIIGGTVDPVTGVDHQDTDGDNRLRIGNFVETGNLDDPSTPDYDEANDFDFDNDGYIDELDLFLGQFGTLDATTGRYRVTTTALETGGVGAVQASQLVKLIDTFGDPTRDGYNDGVIDSLDRYSKLRGEIHLKSDEASWNAGAAGGAYESYVQGPIQPEFNENAMNFQSGEVDKYQFGPSDFNVDYYRNLVSDPNNELDAQALPQVAANPGGVDPDGPQPLGNEVTESVPFGAAHPYDYYTRPVYENMTFTNVRIPKGTNALFKNCTFIGVTFVETETNIAGQADFNYAGMQEADGEQKHPDRFVSIDGQDVYDTKTIANNIRFDGCRFEGTVVSDAPNEFAHVRNKVAFTGRTQFEIDNSAYLTDEEKQLYKRSTILTPHVSVEMGTFIAPHDNNETVDLSGTIVAGVLDMRGQVTVNGSIITTFEPQSNTGPVLGDTSPQFNTTLGYFSKSQGDLEAEVPTTGLGVIQVRLDPTLPMPDVINGPIEFRPIYQTYYEGTP